VIVRVFVQISLLCALVFTERSFGAIVNAFSAGSTDVQNAINSAVNGDTVLVPASSSGIWTTGVTINKSIALNLAGSTVTFSGGTLNIDPQNSGTLVVSNAIFNIAGDASGTIELNDTSGGACYRLCYITINAVGSTLTPVMNLNGRGAGLIDHVTITNIASAREFIHVNGWGAVNTTGWTTGDSTTFQGSSNLTYIEDCTFVGKAGNANTCWIEGYYGCRVVYRYNTFNYAAVDAHGTPGNVGQRWWECYMNTFTNKAVDNQSWAFNLRAGSGVIFSNKFVGQRSADIAMCEEDSGYPASYQIGRGLNQVLDPAYVWGNTGMTLALNQCDAPEQPNMVQLNRDVYAAVKPGYAPLTYPHPLQSSNNGNRPPLAVAHASPTNGPVPLTINFSSAGSTDPDGTALTYSWTFGDGGTSIAANPVYTYQTNGAFVARLTVSDGTNSTTSSGLSIGAGNQPPIAKATAAPIAGAPPLAVAFSSLGSLDPEGASLTYAWTFGDGATSTAANPSHTYLVASNYVAYLTVSDGTNTARSINLTINVFNPSTGLVAAFGFEEGSGSSISDESGNGNSGTISGATWTNSGRFGKALSFDGIGAKVTINDSASLDLTSGMTLEAWVYPTALGGWRDIIFKAVDIYYLSGSSPQASVPATGGTYASGPLYGTSALPLNTWSHLAATCDGTTLSLYVNGVQTASRPETGSVNISSGAVTIGGDATYGQFWDGLIDEVRIYNRALSAGEIQNDMNIPVSSRPAPPTGLHIVSGQ
jgi:PKD repeat protein